MVQAAVLCSCYTNPLFQGGKKIKTKQVILNEGAKLRTGLQMKCTQTGEVFPNPSEGVPTFFDLFASNHVFAMYIISV